MFADEDLAQRVAAKDRGFFRDLAPAVRLAGLEGQPFLDLGSTIAFFAGDGSPLTQAIGIFTEEDLRAIDEFFAGRATSWEAV